MKIEIKCPKCDSPLSVLVQDVCYEVKCPSCARWILPIEDVGIPCPSCGEVVLTPHGEARRGASCLSCGHSFTGRRRLRLAKYWYLLAIPVIVIAVILLAVYLPPLFESGPSPANEAAAISALRTLSSAQELFNTRYGTYGDMDGLYQANMIDVRTAQATEDGVPKSGYVFIVQFSGSSSWTGIALPADPGVTGSRSFFIDETGVIRAETCESWNDQPAGPNSPPLISGIR